MEAGFGATHGSRVQKDFVLQNVMLSDINEVTAVVGGRRGSGQIAVPMARFQLRAPACVCVHVPFCPLPLPMEVVVPNAVRFAAEFPTVDRLCVVSAGLCLHLLKIQIVNQEDFSFTF